MNKQKEFEAKLKETFLKDESLKGSIVTVNYTCKKTKKKYLLQIGID